MALLLLLLLKKVGAEKGKKGKITRKNRLRPPVQQGVYMLLLAITFYLRGWVVTLAKGGREEGE